MTQQKMVNPGYSFFPARIWINHLCHLSQQMFEPSNLTLSETNSIYTTLGIVDVRLPSKTPAKPVKDTSKTDFVMVNFHFLTNCGVSGLHVIIKSGIASIE